MMQAYQILQDVVFDGGWDGYAARCFLRLDIGLTRLAQESHDMPGLGHGYAARCFLPSFMRLVT